MEKKNAVKKNGSNGGKTAKEKLAAGAKEIRDAQKAKDKAAELTVTPPPQPIDIPPLTRGIQEILTEHVAINKENTAVTLSDAIPLNESLAVLDYFQGIEGHVGFMIGDVINQSERIHGGKYVQAMAQTGRALSTLKAYVQVAKSIPPERRKAALGFSVHREVARIESPQKQEKVLNDVLERTNKGKAPSVIEVRAIVNKVDPPKRKPAKPSKKATSGKGKKGGKVTPPYEPTAEEQAELDALSELLDATVTAVRNKTLTSLVLKIANDRKRDLLKLLKPIADFTFTLEKHTGY